MLLGGEPREQETLLVQDSLHFDLTLPVAFPECLSSQHPKFWHTDLLRSLCLYGSPSGMLFPNASLWTLNSSFKIKSPLSTEVGWNLCSEHPLHTLAQLVVYQLWAPLFQDHEPLKSGQSPALGRVRAGNRGRGYACTWLAKQGRLWRSLKMYSSPHS